MGLVALQLQNESLGGQPALGEDAFYSRHEWAGLQLQASLTAQDARRPEVRNRKENFLGEKRGPL